jgi:hypothetical protein
LNINGYSLGGVFSQVFVYKLIENYEDKLNIDFYNIESWFYGNKEEFDLFSTKINTQNIYNKKSIFYLYNHYIQSYFNNIKIINNNNDDNILNILKDSVYPLPMGIINYINKNHLLSKLYNK